jgi:hypothetical protein
MLGAVEGKDSSRTDLHRDEYIDDAEPVTATKKSQATMAVAWLWMKVDQR